MYYKHRGCDKRIFVAASVAVDGISIVLFRWGNRSFSRRGYSFARPR